MRISWALLLLLSAVSPSEKTGGQSQPSPPKVLTSVQDVIALSNADAERSLPVKLEATVTYVRPVESSLFVSDNGYGVYVHYGQDLGLIPGDRIVVTGVTEASFRPVIDPSEVQFLSHGALPRPQSASFEDLIQAKFDSQYVQIEGTVLTAVYDKSKTPATILFRVRLQQGFVAGIVANPGALRPEQLVDADVRMRGVAGGVFDSRMQMAGVHLHVYSEKDIDIAHPATADPWSLAPRPVDQVIYAYRNGNVSQRVKIAGTLTYFEPGSLAVIESQGKAILVKTKSSAPLHAGDGVTAIGFPGITDENVHLEDGEFRPATGAPAIQPQSIQWEKASTGAYNLNLVSMEGEVVAQAHDSRVDLFILKSDGHLFSATMRHSSSDAADPVANDAPPPLGSRVRVTGVCFVDSGNHWRDRLWFDLRMRSPHDVVVLQQPSWWTVKRMAYMVTAMSAVILLAVIWVGLLDRRLRQQNAVIARQSQEDAMRERRLARQEQQRSHILELISSSSPLPDVLREIQATVSQRLLGALCWFELHASTGGRPEAERPSGPAIVFQELFSPDGSSLGFLLATPHLQSAADADISAALVAGARLAELAIDTRRLYSDLHHRSEYDLLTDIPNRFSMERRLDQLMLSARSSDAVFGLIYVDLDRFKLVNDRYGHHIGDLYLQEATRRMKLQLRTGDVLARIGGDEFIALVPILRSRADAEEIATRLERCFDDLFELEGYRMPASASIGLAVYPEDGASKEELQRSADAAMYANKESKRHQEKLEDAMRRIWSEHLKD